jgi:hypothetical protein
VPQYEICLCIECSYWLLSGVKHGASRNGTLWYGSFLQNIIEALGIGHSGCAIYVCVKLNIHNSDLLKKLVFMDGAMLCAQLPKMIICHYIFEDLARDEKLMQGWWWWYLFLNTKSLKLG